MLFAANELASQLTLRAIDLFEVVSQPIENHGIPSRSLVHSTFNKQHLEREIFKLSHSLKKYLSSDNPHFLPSHFKSENLTFLCRSCMNPCIYKCEQIPRKPMAPTVVYSYDDSADVADKVAKLIIASQNAALSRNSKFTIAVSGGSLGKVLNKGLIENKENLEKVKWEQWQVYFSDERLVPLDHEDSNYGLFNKMVLQPLLEQHRPEPHVIPIDEVFLTEDGSKDSQLAHEYEKKLPGSLDLILLGCGPDGHTCSLFPNHSLLKERGCRIAAISDSPKPPPRRITFTLPVLEAAKEICFVAEGEGKASVLQQIFGKETSNLPCEIVNGLQVKVSWFTNTPAVNGVDVKLSKYNL